MVGDDLLLKRGPTTARRMGGHHLEPPGIDVIARENRLDYYYRVPLEGWKRLMSAYGPVGVSLRITDDWYTAPNGRIPFPGRHSNWLEEAHFVTLVSYSDATGTCTFHNSWGSAWGDRGLGTISYALLEQTWIEGWAWGLMGRLPPKLDVTGKATWNLWDSQDTIGIVRRGCDLIAPDGDRGAWTFGVVWDGILWLEDFFVKPNLRRRGVGKRMAWLVANICEKHNLDPCF